MSYYDELSPIYTFSLCITEEGSTIVDTTVNVKATAEEITRAKQTIQRLLDTYALAIEPPQASESELWNQPPVDPADQPEPETERVADDLMLGVPPGALVLDREGPRLNGWGEFSWVKYLLPYTPRKKKRAKRKRPKKE